jgi:hypothetical protein
MAGFQPNASLPIEGQSLISERGLKAASIPEPFWREAG